MTVAPSFQDFVDQGQAEAQARRPDLSFFDGNITLAQNHGAAAMADTVTRLAVQLFRNTFLDGAQGDDLTALVDDHYNIQRTAAVLAQANVDFTRTSAGAGGTIPAGTTIATDFDAQAATIEFVTDSAVVVGAGANGPFSVAVTAVLSGPEGNVGAAKIARIVDALFDATFSVTNAAVAGGGSDEESDTQLRERARAFFPTLRRGTLAALETGALVVPSVKVAVAFEDPTNGLVTVRVTDADGNSTLQMVSDVVTELENWRCAGTPLSVTGGSVLSTNVAIVLANVKAGFDVAARAQDIIDAVEARMRKLVVGETMFLDSVIAQVIAVAPDDIFDVAFTAPTADVVPATGEVIRPNVVTVT